MYAGVCMGYGCGGSLRVSSVVLFAVLELSLNACYERRSRPYQVPQLPAPCALALHVHTCAPGGALSLVPLCPCPVPRRAV